jgi:heme oxygenase
MVGTQQIQYDCQIQSKDLSGQSPEKNSRLLSNHWVLKLSNNRLMMIHPGQNLELYLSNKFRPARWLDSIFDQPAPTHAFKSFSRLEELDLLANYIRLIDQNYSRQLGVMWKVIEVHQYCQFQLFVKSLKAVKDMLTRIAESS